MRRALILVAVVLVAGCGARKELTPPKDKPLPVKPFGAKATPTANQLLKPPIQTRPARRDDLLQSSETRRSDEYDLPPQN